MTDGHGDDAYKYRDIRINFSSNVYTHFDHTALFRYLTGQLGSIATYPEPTPDTLERELARHLRLRPENVCVTNGATEAIYLIAQTFRSSRTAILQPTFAEYADACRLHDHRIRSIYSIDQIPDDAETVWLCNPNNPTGQVLPLDTILQTIEQQRLFIIDQSYAPFTTERLLSPKQAAQQANVLLLHSMTKQFAIPGLRLGYITGPEALLREVRTHRMPWSVNQLAISAAHYLLAHTDDYALPLVALMSERERLADALQQTRAIEVWPSQSHILLCHLRYGRADALKDYLAHTHHLLIRDASNFEGLSPQHFRIAVQSPAENDQLLAAILQWIAS